MQNNIGKEEAEVECDDNFISIIDRIPNPIIVANVDLSIRYVNPAFVELSGWLPQDVIGTQAPYPWWPVSKRQEYLEELAKIKTQGSHKSEWLFTRKDGKEFWIKVTAKPVVKKGEVQFMIASWVEITGIMNELIDLRRFK